MSISRRAKSASSRTWLPHESPIPERVQELAEELLLVGANAAAEQHQQIDIGLETEMTTAVAAEGQHGDVRLGPRDFGEQLPQHRIDAVGVALERGAAAGATQGVRFELGTRGIERRHESGSAGARLCK